MVDSSPFILCGYGGELSAIAHPFEIDDGRDHKPTLGAGKGLDVRHLHVRRWEGIIDFEEADAKLEGIALTKEAVVEAIVIDTDIARVALARIERILNINELGGLLGLVTLDAGSDDTEVLRHVEDDGRFELGEGNRFW